MGLPVEVGSFEVGKLGGPESRVQKGPDDEFLFVGVAGIGQAGCLVCRERFTFVLRIGGGLVLSLRGGLLSR